MAPAFCLRWQAQRGAGTGKPVEGDLGAAGTPDAGVKGFKEGQVIPYAEYRRAYGRKRLIEEVKEKIAANEDALLEIPKEIQTCNDALMMETMTFCYDRLRTNCKEAEEIAEWIKKVRVELKKNIIRKQNREINNKEIYAYMHDIFGKDIINLFDVQNDDVDLITGEDRPSGDTTQDKQLSKDVQKGDV